MMKLSNGTKTIEITMHVWTGNGYDPDWSRDFFDAGSLPYDAENDVYFVEDVDYCTEQAADWTDEDKNNVVDFCEIDTPKNLKFESKRVFSSWEAVPDGLRDGVLTYWEPGYPYQDDDFIRDCNIFDPDFIQALRLYDREQKKTKKYHVKPEFFSLWGEFVDEETIITQAELENLSREWEKPIDELLDQLEELD